MIKLYFANDSKQGIGGAWSFIRNLKKGLLGKVEMVETVEECDIFLISGVTMVQKNTVYKARDLKKKIIVRIDNCPRNSRNRNTGTSRLRGFSQLANEVIWQSEWARWYLKDFVGRDGKIIYNGVDLDVFKPEGATLDFHNKKEDTYLYSRFNRDEGKRFEQVYYEYQLIQRNNRNAKLILVGKFSPDNQEYNFDFFRGERYEYYGIVDNPETMARIYRSCKYMFAPYYNDCYSNAYLEGALTGIELCGINMSGGTPELLENIKKGREFNGIERMAKDYVKVFEEVVGRT